MPSPNAFTPVPKPSKSTSPKIAPLIPPILGRFSAKFLSLLPIPMAASMSFSDTSADAPESAFRLSPNPEISLANSEKSISLPRNPSLMPFTKRPMALPTEYSTLPAFSIVLEKPPSVAASMLPMSVRIPSTIVEMIAIAAPIPAAPRAMVAGPSIPAMLIAATNDSIAIANDFANLTRTPGLMPFTISQAFPNVYITRTKAPIIIAALVRVFALTNFVMNAIPAKIPPRAATTAIPFRRLFTSFFPRR